MSIPNEVSNLLKTEKFCFLATSHRDQPHVCLMNFTFIEDDGVVILSSREETTKVDHIKKNPAVSLLLYNLGKSIDASLSVTLNGTATIANNSDDARYREEHYRKNSDMESFIKGDNILVIAVKIDHGLISDYRDSVFEWSLQ